MLLGSYLWSGTEQRGSEGQEGGIGKKQKLRCGVPLQLSADLLGALHLASMALQHWGDGLGVFLLLFDRLLDAVSPGKGE